VGGDPVTREQRVEQFAAAPENQALILRLGLAVGENFANGIDRLEYVRDLAYTVGNAKAHA
jgi:hypothetical protein